jgi:hypothetical protein
LRGILRRAGEVEGGKKRRGVELARFVIVSSSRRSGTTIILLLPGVDTYKLHRGHLFYNLSLQQIPELIHRNLTLLLSANCDP